MQLLLQLAGHRGQSPHELSNDLGPNFPLTVDSFTSSLNGRGTASFKVLMQKLLIEIDQSILVEQNEDLYHPSLKRWCPLLQKIGTLFVGCVHAQNTLLFPFPSHFFVPECLAHEVQHQSPKSPRTQNNESSIEISLVDVCHHLNFFWVLDLRNPPEVELGASCLA